VSLFVLPKVEDEGRFLLVLYSTQTHDDEQLHKAKDLAGTSNGELSHSESGRLVESPYVSHCEKDPEAARRNRQVRE
jgi:hypothetical protein